VAPTNDRKVFAYLGLCACVKFLNRCGEIKMAGIGDPGGFSVHTDLSQRIERTGRSGKRLASTAQVAI